jgi:hypothetical protein
MLELPLRNVHEFRRALQDLGRLRLHRHHRVEPDFTIRSDNHASTQPNKGVPVVTVRFATLSVGAAALIFSAAMLAQEPVLNVSPQLHGNIASAQELVRQAFDRITTAQQDNRYNLGGHAAKAKDLLRQANEELKLAAEAANRR